MTFRERIRDSKKTDREREREREKERLMTR